MKNRHIVFLLHIEPLFIEQFTDSLPIVFFLVQTVAIVKCEDVDFFRIISLQHFSNYKPIC